MLLSIIQILLSLILVSLILLQPRGSGGLGSAFGAGSEGNLFRTRRGLEKIIFRGTIIIAFAFLLSAFIRLILK